MVPNGWEKGVVEDIAKVSSGGTPSRQNESYWLGGQVPWVTTTEVKLGIITNTEQKITEEGLKNSSAKLFPKDTILMAMYGQGKTRGQVAKLGIEASTNQACAALQLNEGFEVDYYYQYLISQYENIRDLANSGGQQNLSGGIIKGIHVPIPPLPEQRKIAKILGTWDKAISTTERLIDNSKQQKKALMQQLLSGDNKGKRLLDDSGKPFEGEWEEVRLDDIAKYQKGYTYKSNEYSESATSNGFLTLKSILRGGGYSASGIKYLLNSVDEKFTVKTGDVVFAVTDLTRNAEVVGAPIFIPKLPFEKTYISMDLVKLKLNSSVNKQFIYYLLKIPCNRNFMRARASGSTVLHLDVQGSKKLQLFIPKLIEEQKTIATVLTNADKEIELLEQQLTDFKQEKKALMQQLLTGKRRVKIAKEAV